MGIIKNYQSKGGCKVTFSYPTSAQEGAKTVQVLGDFNNWDSKAAPKMKKGKNEFSTVVEIKSDGKYEFRYLIDNNKWDNDFAADGYTASPYSGINNSVLVLESPAKVTSPKAVSPKAKTEKKSALTAPTVEKKPKVVKPAEKKPDVKTAVKKEKPSVKKVAKATPTVKKNTAIKSEKDDLKKIEGIGPKIAEILAGKGISTFSGLAKAKSENLKKILEEAGPKFNVHDPSTWPVQAGLASKGKWDELKKLQDELNAGKAKK